MGLRRNHGLNVWMMASSLGEVWVHVLPQLCVFLFLFVVFHQRGLTLYETFWVSFPLGYCLISWIVFLLSALVGQLEVAVVRGVYTAFTVAIIPLLVVALRRLV